ncbi:MAG: hypothetical protein IRY95_05675 [Clostridia bacterium]|nr:hypothetical protein [Clostridia bacterium]
MAVTWQTDGVTLTVRVGSRGTSVETYRARVSLPVVREGRTTSLTALRNGDLLEMTVQGDEVVSLQAEPANREVEGEIAAVDVDRREVTVSLEDGEEETFEVPEDADVERDGRDADLGDLRVGDAVTLSLEKRQVVRVEAEPRSTEVRGKVRAITIANPPEIVLERDGRQYRYPVARGVQVEVGGTERASLYDLKLGAEVRLTVTGGEVTRVRASAQPSLDDLKGIVRRVDGRNDRVTLELLDGGSEVEVEAAADVVVVRGTSVSRDVAELDKGDIVLVIGNDRVGRFEAEVIVVIGGED